MSLRETRRLTTPLEQAILVGCAVFVVAFAVDSLLPRGAFVPRVALGVVNLACMVVTYAVARRGSHLPH